MRPVCTECNESAMPLLTSAVPSSSEYYCKKCHKSYEMTDGQYRIEVQIRRGSSEPVAA